MCGAPAAHAAHPALLSPVPQQTTLALRSPSRLLSSGASPEAPPAKNAARTSFVHGYQVLRTIRVATLIIGQHPEDVLMSASTQRIQFSSEATGVRSLVDALHSD